jgi:uncharacterized protein
MAYCADHNTTRSIRTYVSVTASNDSVMSHHFREDQLLEAIEHGDYGRAVQLLSSGISINAILLSRTRRESATVLATAAYEGQLDIMRYLLECHVVVNYQDPLLKRNALHWACMGKRADAVQLLVNSNVDVNCVDRDNVTPIIRAAMLGQLDIVEILIESGAEVGKFDRLHSSALHYATFHGSSDVTGLLIRAGCTPNNPTIFGQGTPLANLIYHRDINNIQLLFEAGYRPSEDGWIRQYLSKEHSTNIAAYLRAEYHSPCSLARLCRTAIREQMRGVYVHRKILSLSLPLTIKHYLMLV